MTSLRDFQDEIEDIHSREVAKQRTQLAADKQQKEHKTPDQSTMQSEELSGRVDAMRTTINAMDHLVETEEIQVRPPPWWSFA